VKGTSGKTPTAIFHALSAAVPGGRVSAVTSPLMGYESLVASRRLIAIIFSAIATFALALAAVGVYGILSYMVGQRYREFAMRIALGAQNGDVFEIVWHSSLVMVLAGTGIGAFGALAFGPLLGEYWLNHVLPSDVWSLVAAEAVLMLVGLAACIGPVRRAMRADPVDLLRSM
jgi:ABC-type antimicrobial peptide transport system permease subunit